MMDTIGLTIFPIVSCFNHHYVLLMVKPHKSTQGLKPPFLPRSDSKRRMPLCLSRGLAVVRVHAQEPP